MSAIGLHTARQRRAVRDKAFKAAYQGYLDRGHTVYTEGFRRWSGIEEDRRAYKHESPLHADCSAFVTWCLWDATRAERLGDFVNGLHWGGGYTGTMTQHGQDIGSYKSLLTADAVFYGGSWEVPAHVAIYIGDGKVISHGMQGDPRIYNLNLGGALPIIRYKRYVR